MPPIALHMVLARQIAEGAAQGTLESQSGPFLLGATTPDIRVPTRQDRFSTHYFDLNRHDHQDSVAEFLKANQQPAGKFTYSQVIIWLIAYYKTYGKEAL